jgi:hypothetical protein
MPSLGTQQSKQKTPIYQNTWQRGMITSVPPEDIPIDAARLLLNLEFDEESNLITRNGTSLFLTVTGETGRITSAFRAKYSDGTVWILITTGTKLFRCTESGGSLTNITGALTFPNNTKWQWVMFGDFAIGVNGATSGTNPVKVNAAGTASLLANAPFAKFVEVWNTRVWMVAATAASQSVVLASAINAPEDWTVDDDAGAITIIIGAAGGDTITGIKAFKGSFYVYFRNRIEVITPIGSPATIPGNLRVDIYTRNVGCISGYSIQNVIDDQLFLADCGVMSLVLAPLGELKGSIISQNIQELGQLKKNSSVFEIEATVRDDVNQYMISIPSTVSSSGLNEGWILDYQKINQRDELGFPIVRWTKVDGLILGTAFSERLDQDYKTYLIAGYPVASVDTKIYAYQPNNPTKTFSDNGIAYTQQLQTKFYFNVSALLRSLWHRFGLGLTLISDLLDITIDYFYDNKESVSGSYPETLNAITQSIALYGSGVFGTALWTSPSQLFRDRVLWRQFRKNNFGRKARTVALSVRCTTVNQGFVIKSVEVDGTLLNHKRTRSV